MACLELLGRRSQRQGKGSQVDGASAPRPGRLLLAGVSNMLHVRATACWRLLAPTLAFPAIPTTCVPCVVLRQTQVWQAMSQDDAPAFDDEEPIVSGRHRHPQCLSTVPDYRLASFQPHAIDYQKVQVLTPNAHLLNKNKPEPSCQPPRSHSIGGGAFEWITQKADEPYDAVALYAGSWDAAFTSRNETAVEAMHELGSTVAVCELGSTVDMCKRQQI